MNIEKEVADYYDKNTKKFLSWGHGKKNSAIHRAVWAPGIKTRFEAIQYQNNMIWKLIDAMHLKDTFHVLDLGCGVGGSLFYLYEQAQKNNLDVYGYGLTNSTKQQLLALDYIKSQKIKNIVIDYGNFHEIPASIPLANIVYLIESFIHSDSPESLISQIKSKLVAHGTIIIIDDFLAKNTSLSKQIRTFQKKWFAPNLLTTKKLDELLHKENLAIKHKIVLNEYLELHRFRDYSIAALAPFIKKINNNKYIDSLIGGNALRNSLLDSTIEYCYLEIGSCH